MVVERNGHTHVVERGRVALQVLYGIRIGMKYVWVGHHLVRGGCGPLYQVVIVGIHAGYHVCAHAVAQQVHQHGLLAALQQMAPGRQHYLEEVLRCLKVGQYGSPEEHVIVALHIGYDTAARVP